MLISQIYNSDGEAVLTLEASEKREDHIRLSTPDGDITISWFQARDICYDLNRWLVNTAHIVSREN